MNNLIFICDKDPVMDRSMEQRKTLIQFKQEKSNKSNKSNDFKELAPAFLWISVQYNCK